MVDPDSGLPAEAKGGEYWTEQIDGTWVYSTRFARETDDGCTPAVDEIAKHICETLHILGA